MGQKYWVAIFKEDTQANQVSDTPARKTKLQKAVQDTYAHIKSRGGKPDPQLPTFLIRPYCLFVAPEYLFANPVATADHEVGMERQVDEDAKVQIEKFIKDLSHNHPGMILVPGSVAWHKPFNRDYNDYLKRKKALDAPSLADMRERTGVYQYQFNKKKPRKDKATASLQAYKERLNKTAGPLATQQLGIIDMYVCPNSSCSVWHDAPRLCSYGHGPLQYDQEWTSCFNCGGAVEPWDDDVGLLTHDKCPHCNTRLLLRAKTTDDALALVPTTTAVKMARNTVYVYLNGERKSKYHKQAGFHEVLNDRKQSVFIPGKKQMTVAIDGKWYGIEVCLDHGAGALKTPQDIFTGIQADFHIIMSAQIEPVFGNTYVKPGGWVVSASSNENYCKLYKVGTGSWTEQTGPQKVGDVDVYEIEV